jgi:trans-2,3-dihydro-3-hydroxyanthranilate isomerase
MTFAGHPTIGTAWVLMNEGMIAPDHPRYSLEELVGPVSVRIDAGEPSLIWLTTPSITFGSTVGRDAGAELLGLLPKDLLDVLPQHVTAGNPTLFVAVRDPLTVDRAVLNATTLQSLKGAHEKPFCVFVFAPTPSGAYSRMFAPDYGISEDPATGSATGPLAAFMMRHGLASGAAGSRWVSEQGTKMGRRSLLHILVGDDRGTPRIEVGGNVAPLAEATLTI